MAASFRRMACTFPAACVVHVAEEAPGFTSWARRNAPERYTQTDFLRNNALGFVSTIAATVAITRSRRRALALTYYTLVVTQQAIFNALFHVGTTLAYREYSPCVVTSVLTVPLWGVPDPRDADGVPAQSARHRRLHAARRHRPCRLGARQLYFVGVPDDQGWEPIAPSDKRR